MPRDRERIRALNDQMRADGPSDREGVLWLFTPGVHALGISAIAEAVRRVRLFDAFDAANDPHGEHDFGSFDLYGERLFWKIDYYDRSLADGSPDPTSEELTCRVLTIMRALEY